VWAALSLVQAVWLKRADPSSMALYWYLAAFLLQLTVYVMGLAKVMPSASNALGPVALVFWIVGIFVFRREMIRYFNKKDDVGLGLTIPMALFFNTLYFQYHFNEIAAFKRRHPESTTPVAG